VRWCRQFCGVIGSSVIQQCRHDLIPLVVCCISDTWVRNVNFAACISFGCYFALLSVWGIKLSYNMNYGVCLSVSRQYWIETENKYVLTTSHVISFRFIHDCNLSTGSPSTRAWDKDGIRKITIFSHYPAIYQRSGVRHNSANIAQWAYYATLTRTSKIYRDMTITLNHNGTGFASWMS